ncbi:MAG TPA: serine hydrolase domain-containing protein [Gemmatimonadales bacterium]|nr:serine hydrolase domain-containing protein [Gemmatimonadales bacterium]
MHRATGRCGAALAALLLAACGRTPRLPEPVSSQVDFAAEVSRRAPKILEERHVPGLAVALVQDGRVAWTKGFGRANVGRYEKMRPNTVVEAGDLAQPLTAWGVWRLVEQGRLDLDAPVDRYLTHWHLPPSPWDESAVTLRRVLTHTAGLSLRTIAPTAARPQELPTLAQALAQLADDERAARAERAERIERGDSADENDALGDAAAGLRLVQAPGTGWRYSSGGYALLQLVVEETTHEPFADYMRAEVLQPLGLKSTGFAWRDDFRGRRATGYARDGRAVPPLLHPAPGASGLYTTVEDFAHWLAADLPGRRAEAARRGLLSTATIFRLHAPVPAARGPLGYWTLGGTRTDTLTNGVVYIAHGGAAPGFTTWFAAIPERGAGIVIFANREDAWSAIADLYCPWAETAGGGVPANVCGI